MNGLLNTLKFVYTVSTDIIQFVCSNGELVHMMPRLQFNVFVQRFISEGCEVYVLVHLPDMNLVKTYKTTGSPSYEPVPL